MAAAGAAAKSEGELASAAPHDEVEVHRAAVRDADPGYVGPGYVGPGYIGSISLGPRLMERLVSPGDTVIVISYADYNEAELEAYVPPVVHLDRPNAVRAVNGTTGPEGPTGHVAVGPAS